MFEWKWNAKNPTFSTKRDMYPDPQTWKWFQSHVILSKNIMITTPDNPFLFLTNNTTESTTQPSGPAAEAPIGGNYKTSIHDLIRACVWVYVSVCCVDMCDEDWWLVWGASVAAQVGWWWVMMAGSQSQWLPFMNRIQMKLLSDIYRCVNVCVCVYVCVSECPFCSLCFS